MRLPLEFWACTHHVHVQKQGGGNVSLHMKSPHPRGILKVLIRLKLATFQMFVIEGECGLCVRAFSDRPKQSSFGLQGTIQITITNNLKHKHKQYIKWMWHYVVVANVSIYNNHINLFWTSEWNIFCNTINKFLFRVILPFPFVWIRHTVGGKKQYRDTTEKSKINKAENVWVAIKKKTNERRTIL